MMRATVLVVFSFFCAGSGLAQVTFALHMRVRCDAKNATAPMKVEDQSQNSAYSKKP